MTKILVALGMTEGEISSSSSVAHSWQTTEREGRRGCSGVSLSAARCMCRKGAAAAAPRHVGRQSAEDGATRAMQEGAQPLQPNNCRQARLQPKRRRADQQQPVQPSAAPCSPTGSRGGRSNNNHSRHALLVSSETNSSPTGSRGRGRRRIPQRCTSSAPGSSPARTPAPRASLRGWLGFAWVGGQAG